ncbi:MAG: hypothetical protein CME27_05010 [Gemmatimonadetes bacterium]|nr:hypothetical protein [Gemmatimonadota bacterium]|tara:strand:+ start:867 stop:1355 length:489 start_codon:yes stop_codon:yes gene_type:complete
MNGIDCAKVRDCLPDFESGRIENHESVTIESHLLSCEDCQSELELIQMLRDGSPAVPVLLADQIENAVSSSRRPWNRSRWGPSVWGLPAAAVLVALVVGVGVSRDRSEVIQDVVFDFGVDADPGELWLSDDSFLAGDLWIENLSNETLMELLVELEGEGAAR